MNQEKAREFFSSYYEGTLDPGLKQALEQAMGKDASLRGEYREFENAYEDLGSLKFETIEIPFDLNDKILANIDKHIYEARRNQQPSWMMWLRNVAIAGVSCVAILGAALSLRNLGRGPAQAGTVGLGSAKEALTIDPANNRNVTIHFEPSRTDSLVIREGVDGKELRQMTVPQGNEIETTLENASATAKAFELETKGDTRTTVIVLPGSSPTPAKTGEGTLEEFAIALAGHYRVPVEIRVATPNVEVKWNFDVSDAVSAANGSLGSGYAIMSKANNLLVISDN